MNQINTQPPLIESAGKNSPERSRLKRLIGRTVVVATVAVAAPWIANTAATNWAEKAKAEQHELQTTQEQMHHQDLIDKVSQDVGADPRAASEQYLSEQPQPENP